MRRAGGKGEDGIMTGLSPPNGVCEGGSRAEKGREKEEEEEDPNLSNERLGAFLFQE